MEVFKRFKFEAAHFLPKVPEGHKCKRLHGHSYGVILYLKGPYDAEKGWVVDFSEIKQIFAPILETLDHQLLNEIEGLENPTSEALAIWIWNKLKPQLPLLSKVELSETASSGCIYEGD